MKNLLLTGLFMALLIPGAWAQFQVSGKVTDPLENAPIPGVNIVVEGSSVGTTTDMQGNYSLQVPNENAVLVFSFIGYTTKEVTVGNQTTINIELSQDVTELGEVVVTALGIEREEGSLTYATQQIDAEELTTVKEQNLVNSLAGKTAGISITRTAGGVGSSSRVLLRGNKSINGPNEPLYVIDGVPMNSGDLGTATDLFGTVDNGDAIGNLNPDDIESINVLKGASAAALYGSQAANGVILITTKKGKEGSSQVSFSSSITFESPLLTPDLQSKYGQDAPGASLSTWGSANNTASEDHVDEFFRTGSTFINSLSLSSGNDLGQYYISYARTDAKGIVPENNMEKNNFMVRLSGKVFDKVTVDGSANFINQKIKNTPLPGFYHNPVLATYMYPESFEAFKDYKSNYEVFDPARNLNAQNYPYKDNNYIFTAENPYWIVNRQPNDSWRNRGIYKLGITVPVASNLKVMGRVNLDRIEDQFEQRLYATSSAINVNTGGDYQTRSQTSSFLYSDLLLTYNKYFGDNLSLNATAGFSNYYTTVESMLLRSTGDNTVGIIVPNYFAIQNLQSGFYKEETATEELLQAAFATASLGIKDMVFVDFTLRNEWSSTLPSDNNSFLYPSGGLTFILSELIGQSDALSFAKIRGSYSEVGNDLPFGYAFAQPRTINGNGQIQSPTTAPLGELSPERSKSFELGTNLKFLNNKIGLDITYYNNKIEDQIFTIPAAVGDAYENYYINGGAVRNSGIEAMLSADVATSGALTYSTIFNFSKNNNEVLSIDPRLENSSFIVTKFVDGRMMEIRVEEGGSYGDFYGIDFLRDSNGNIEVLEETDPNTGEVTRSIQTTPSNELVYLGNPNPDWQLGWQNTFHYKNFTFKFLIDGKFGGEVLSQTESILDSYGRSQASADARDAEVVNIGGQSFDPQFYYTSVGGIAGVGSQYVYDATNVRLRELSLGYTLPAGFLGKAVKSMTLSAIGRNLFFFKNDAPFDPEVSAGSSNVLQGMHTFFVPSTRSYGFSLKATF
ncbi:SusC/RagA family TonB-linked outer membrane protein [Fulvivirga ligni]|uniref:SusC/RagA family TonB-linked outer membrane protein n=1 Tax=Fulvivirga ligni TaxID=2904246 RepID=UPI001F225C60|nr:SusC/RagA family TonB-linked outer membrane protein [Fulvivirga ligni]UII22883.1 SusC/RagA family TonB-linked outer membrane protein [Fulvivirga ligni]